MKTRTATMLLAAALAAGTLFAQPDPPAAAPKPDGRDRLMEKLQLTDQQKDQMRKMRTQFQKSNEELASKLRLNRIDLRDLMQAEKPEKAAVQKNVKAATDLQQQMKLNLIDHLFAVREMLTPQQQKIWKEHMTQMIGEARERGMEMRKGLRQGMRRGMQ
jgi:Spy/CpxP family protein refolding chaperone